MKNDQKIVDKRFSFPYSISWPKIEDLPVLHICFSMDVDYVPRGDKQDQKPQLHLESHLIDNSQIFPCRHSLSRSLEYHACIPRIIRGILYASCKNKLQQPFDSPWVKINILRVNCQMGEIPRDTSFVFLSIPIFFIC